MIELMFSLPWIQRPLRSSLRNTPNIAVAFSFSCPQRKFPFAVIS